MVERLVRLGVDVGDARVGIAQSDADAILATPVCTLDRARAAPELQRIITATGATRIYVGLPKKLDGSEGPAAVKARAFIEELASLEVIEGEPEYDVYLVDERMTTVSAHRALVTSGRKTKAHRPVVDQVAAVMILQTALEQERARGCAAGDAWA